VQANLNNPELQKAIEVCKRCRKFNGLKKDGTPKACKLKRIMGCLQCTNWSKIARLKKSA